MNSQSGAPVAGAPSSVSSSGADARAENFVQIVDVVKKFGDTEAVRSVSLTVRKRAVRAARQLGLRQVDVAADARGPRDGHVGQDPDRRRGPRADAAVQAAREHDVPVVCAVPAHVGRVERRVRSQAGRHAEGRAEGARRFGARTRADEQVREAQAASAVRRPAAARRARALAGQAAEAAAARRADVRARQADPPAHADRGSSTS